METTTMTPEQIKQCAAEINGTDWPSVWRSLYQQARLAGLPSGLATEQANTQRGEEIRRVIERHAAGTFAATA